MNLTSRQSIVLVLAVGLLILIVFIAGTYFEKVKPSEEPETERPISQEAFASPAPVRIPVPGSSEFSTKDYIQPLESNVTGSIYSSRAQLRGVVSSWSLGTLLKKGKLAIAVGEEEFGIILPDKVEFMCLPLTKTSANGTTYKMSEVYVDLTNSQGVMVEVNVVSQKIPEGADITLQVNVDEEENMEAAFIVGYGCDV